MTRKTTTYNRQSKITEVQDAGLVCLLQLKKSGGQAFDSVGLTYGQAMLLTLVERGHSTPGELAQLLDMVAPALSSLVSSLVSKGLLERQGLESDARRVIIALTPAGVTACQQLKNAWRENFVVKLDSLSEKELDVLIGAAQIATRRGLI